MTPERGGWWRSVQPLPAINYGPTHSSSFICHLDLIAEREKAKALCLLDLFALFLKKIIIILRKTNNILVLSGNLVAFKRTIS